MVVDLIVSAALDSDPSAAIAANQPEKIALLDLHLGFACAFQSRASVAQFPA